MKEIIIKPINATCQENRIITRTYLVNDMEVSGKIDTLAVEPLRILGTLLMEKGIKISSMIKDNNLWNIESLRVECEDYSIIAKLLEEIMEYRCSPEKDMEKTNIIRQLPYDVLVKVSNAILNFGKDKDQHTKDMQASSNGWNNHAPYARQYGIILNGNPNEVEDCLTIPEAEPQKRKHLIYHSSRGGYNIKTQGYKDSSMDHYSYRDSRLWD